MGYQIGVFISVVVKINGQTLSADFGKPKTFQLVYQFTIYATVASEAVARRCSVKNMFLEISQNSPENTCARVSFLIKMQVLQPY